MLSSFSDLRDNRHRSATILQHTELDAAIKQIIAVEEYPDTEQQEMNDENRGKVEADGKKGRICVKRH